MIKRHPVYLIYTLLLLAGCAKTGQPHGALTPQRRAELAEERKKEEAAAKAAGYFEIPVTDSPEDIIFLKAYSPMYSESHEQAEWVANMLSGRAIHTREKTTSEPTPKLPPFQPHVRITKERDTTSQLRQLWVGRPGCSPNRFTTAT